MFLKKPLLFQSLNLNTVFTIFIWLLVAWVLARPIKGVLDYTYTLLGSTTSSTFESILQSKSHFNKLIQSKQKAEEQSKIISLLEIKLKYLEELVKETENLKNILNLKQNIRYKTIPSKVIGRSADNWHKQLLLNKGKNSQIKIGDPVLTSKGIVGQVIDVTKTTAIVQLISDPSYKVGCKIKNKNILGIISGKTNIIAILEFIPIGTNIMAGDLVITSGISSGDLLPTYPSGHPIGKVIKVSKKRYKASDLYIEVKLSEDLTTLSNVLVFSLF